MFELYAEVQLTFAIYAKVATFYYVCMICFRKKYSIFPIFDLFNGLYRGSYHISQEMCAVDLVVKVKT